MNINLNPEQERIVNDELKSGHFRSAEEVIAKPSWLFGTRNARQFAADSNGRHDDAVREMLNFVEAKPHSPEGHLG